MLKKSDFVFSKLLGFLFEHIFKTRIILSTCNTSIKIWTWVTIKQLTYFITIHTEWHIKHNVLEKSNISAHQFDIGLTENRIKMADHSSPLKGKYNYFICLN